MDERCKTGEVVVFSAAPLGEPRVANIVVTLLPCRLTAINKMSKSSFEADANAPRSSLHNFYTA
jgi:hypothetical protein